MSVLGYTVFSDDFNRADSGTVGNGWSELDPASILSNQLRIGDAGNNSCGVYRDLTAIGVVPYQMTGTFNISGGTRTHYISPYFCNASYSGLFLTVNLNDTVTIFDGAFGGGGTTLDTDTFTLAAATKYWFWIDLTANGSNYDCNVYLSATSTKPGSPTLTATNFTPSQPSGTYTVFFIDANNANTCDVDFLTYLNSQPSDISDTNVSTDSQTYGLGSESMDTNVSTDTSLVKYAYTNQPKNVSTWVNQSKS